MNNRGDTIFGIHDSGWNQTPIAITQADRLRHVYIIGRTGTGKSTLLENLILQDIEQGRGCAFFDPHGSSATALLERIPSHRTRDVIYFNPKDLEYPIGVNLFADVPPDTEHVVAQGIVSSFQNIWADSWGPRMDRIFYNAVAALLDYGHGTLLGVLRLLIDPVYRKYILSYVKDPIIKQFWEKEYPKYPERLQQEAISPVQNKVERFLSNALMRNIFGQKKNSIDFTSIMQGQKIFIANLSKAEIGELNSNLIGSLLTTTIQIAAMRRIALPKEERIHFPLYIDEFHSFSTESFHTILSESRKFGLSLCVGHQFLSQLDRANPGLKAAVLGNAGTLVAFRLSGEDAKELAQEFEPWPSQELADTDNYQAFIKPLINGSVHEPFRIATLPPQDPPTKEAGEKRIRKIINRSRDAYGTPRSIVEAKIQRWMENDHLSRPPERIERAGAGVREGGTPPEGKPLKPTPPIPPERRKTPHSLHRQGLKRRVNILSWIHEHQLLDTWQLQVLDGGSDQWLSRILQTLTNDGYILRPAGTRPRYTDGNNHAIYALANKGADVLEFERGIKRRKPSGEKINFSGRYRDVTNKHFKHKLLINDLRVLLAQGHQKHFEYTSERAFMAKQRRPKKTWNVPVEHKGDVINIGITPDFIFQLDREDTAYFYEADYSTETIRPGKDIPVSIYKKMIGYYFTWALNIHRELWNIRDFRVPIVTTSEKRMYHMIELNKIFNEGEGSELFLFNHHDQIRSGIPLHQQTWINGKENKFQITS